MAELLLELFSEEIPARMQKGAADELARLLGEALAPLSPRIETYGGPRRIAAAAEVAAEVPAANRSERGPRATAPDAALGGFLRKHGVAREQLTQEGEYWVLNVAAPARPAGALIAAVLPGLLRRFAWPKSMRWGGTSAFTWVRPLRRILCLLDGAIVPFDLRDGADDGHGLASGDVTEGHRFLAPGAVTVSGVAAWRRALAERKVILVAAERRAAIADGVAALAATKGLHVVADDGLLDEVAGLVEWPVSLLGRIDAAYMDLPPEVMQVSMRVNQRYFALRDAEGRPAPWFVFVANIAAPDGGATIVAGNERVLRARFSDARYFWDADRATKLLDRNDALKTMTFHARIGSQFARVRRIVDLAGLIARPLGADTDHVASAAELCKADLTTGMVREFAELQGIMGGYYAAHEGAPRDVCDAIRDQYLPKGPNDALPEGRVGAALAIADRIDQLTQFFAIGEKPSGSGDPFALRRAALGIIRIVREGGFWLSLRPVLEQADATVAADVLGFIVERLKVQLRAEGIRPDMVDAALAGRTSDDMRSLAFCAHALSDFLQGEAGGHLLSAYRRAANILRIEEKNDGLIFSGAPDDALLHLSVERDFGDVLRATSAIVDKRLDRADFIGACEALAQLRGPTDDFFALKMNDERPLIRVNRMRLLALLRSAMSRVADFSKIEG